MESVGNYPNLVIETAHSSGYEIVATYQMDSDVPLPYFSWAEYNFKKPVVWPKQKEAMMAVVISNCAARIKYMNVMLKPKATKK